MLARRFFGGLEGVYYSEADQVTRVRSASVLDAIAGAIRTSGMAGGSGSGSGNGSGGLREHMVSPQRVSMRLREVPAFAQLEALAAYSGEGDGENSRSGSGSSTSHSSSTSSNSRSSCSTSTSTSSTSYTSSTRAI